MGSKNTLLSGMFLFQVSNPGSRQNMINCQGLRKMHYFGCSSWTTHRSHLLLSRTSPECPSAKSWRGLLSQAVIAAP